MNFIKDISNELKQEATVTRRYLELVDFQHTEFQPHVDSEKFGRLAIHIAEIIAWWKNVIEEDELNFLHFEPQVILTTEELLSYFDGLLSESLKALENANESTLTKDWSMAYGEEVYFTLNKKEVLRKFCLNHLIHHRAQLGVYLRLLGEPVPATYGPSASDEVVILTESIE